MTELPDVDAVLRAARPVMRAQLAMLDRSLRDCGALITLGESVDARVMALVDLLGELGGAPQDAELDRCLLFLCRPAFGLKVIIHARPWRWMTRLVEIPQPGIHLVEGHSNAES